MTEREWLECTDLDRMIGASLIGTCSAISTSDRKERLFACASARRVWHLITDARTRFAVEIGERVADGVATQKEIRAGSRSCEAAVKAAFRVVLERPLLSAAADVPRHIFYEFPVQVSFSALSLVRQFAESVHQSCNDSRRISQAAEQSEKAEQIRLLRDLFGNPFRPSTISPTWLTPTVSNLAQAAYDERILPSGELDPDRLAVLSDALEEAGCDDAGILNHLRSPGPHVRGCWALDLLLGKS